MIGRVLPDGTVVDMNGNVIGKAAPSFAGKQVFGPDGKLLGTVGADGLVRDANGNVIGRVLPDGTVVDMDGNPIGKVAEPFEGRKVYGPDGTLLGTVGADGLVRDANGNVIGRVLEDGTVVDLNGNVLGQVGANEKFVGRQVLGPDGKVIGTVGEDGFVRDANGNIIGRVLEDGTVVDLDGNPIGQVSAISGNETVKMAIGRNGEFLGIVGADGYVRDNEGNIIGRVLPDGTIVDMNGNVIGSVMEGEPLRDADGNIIGLILPDGRVVNLNGVEIGRINADGQIVDINGNVIGTWDDGVFTPAGDAAKPKYAYSKTGKKLGIILDDGTVVDENGNIIGYVNENGDIVDANGNIIGTSTSPEEQAKIDAEREAQKTGVSEIPASTGIKAGGAYGVKGYGQWRSERYSAQRIAQLQAMQEARRKSMSLGQLQSASQNDIDKQRRRKQKVSKDWGDQGIKKNASSYRVDMSRMILADKAIPAVLVRSIDSRYTNVPVSAIVERNVYSETGRNILIPAGSRLIGKISSGGAKEGGAPAAASKIAIAWTRMIRPDGVGFVFEPEGSSGDAQGRGGIPAYLDLQLLKRFGLPLLETVVESAALWMMADGGTTVETASGGSTTTTTTGKQQALQDARTNFSDKMQEIFDAIFSELQQISSGSFVPSGTRITVFANQDLWLRTEVEDQEDDANYESKKPKKLIDEREFEMREQRAKEREASGQTSKLIAEKPGQNPSDMPSDAYYGYNPAMTNQQQAPQALVEPAKAPTPEQTKAKNAAAKAAAQAAAQSSAPAAAEDEGVPELF